MRDDLRLLVAEVTVILLIAVCLARQQHPHTKNNPAALLLPNGTIVMKPVERGCNYYLKSSDPIKYHVQSDLRPSEDGCRSWSTDRTKNNRRSIEERISQFPTQNQKEGTPPGRRIWILTPQKTSRRKVAHNEESPNIREIDDFQIVRQDPPAELLPTPEALGSIKNVTIGHPSIPCALLGGVDIARHTPESLRSPSINAPHQHSFKTASSGTSVTPQIDDAEGKICPNQSNRLNLLVGLSTSRLTHANPHCSSYEEAISGECQHNSPLNQPSFLGNPGPLSNFDGNTMKLSWGEHSDTRRMSRGPLNNDNRDNGMRKNLLCNRRMASERSRNLIGQHKPKINTIKGQLNGQLDASQKCRRSPVLRCWCSPTSGVTGDVKSLSNRAYHGCTCYDPSWISSANSSRKVDHCFYQMKTPPVMTGGNYKSNSLPASKNYQKFETVAQNDIEVNPMGNANFGRRSYLFQNDYQREQCLDDCHFSRGRNTPYYDSFNDNVCKGLDEPHRLLHHERLQRSPKDVRCHSFRRHLPGFPPNTIPPFSTCMPLMPVGKRGLDFSLPFIGMTPSYGPSIPSLYPCNNVLFPITLAGTDMPLASTYSDFFASSATLRANPFCKTGPVTRNTFVPCQALPIQVAPTAEPPRSCYNFPINYWHIPLSQFSDETNEISSFTTFVLDENNMWCLIHQEFS